MQYKMSQFMRLGEALRSPPMRLPAEYPMHGIPSHCGYVMPSLVSLVFPSSLPPVDFIGATTMPCLSRLRVRFPIGPTGSNPMHVLA